jgi:syntaxin-binding protein 1
VFFSSPVHKELVAQIKKDSSVLPRIGALSEMNLEYFAIDSQGFTTDHERALEELFSENAEGSHKYNACLNTMATRISTVFASMREFPRVHYRVAKTIDASTMTTLRDLVPTKLAAGVWNCLAKYKTTIPEFPQTETCELLIVDRSIDQIAPIIHEWTYDAMCHDLLCMDGNKYVHEVPSKNGSATEKKEVLLEDHDPVWLELRHAHIADASERLHDKMTHFVSKNKAAQLHQARNGGELSTRDLQKMVQALPQYSDQIDKLSLHVEVSFYIFCIKL